MTNPYHTRNDYSFWSKSVTWPAPGQIDPVVRSSQILQSDRVATMGSCFAQHISRRIAQSGFNYFVPESAQTNQEAEGRNFGVFSCRYGNVYTVRQALQLFNRAIHDAFDGQHVWESRGRYIDGFRPQIEPDGFESREACLADRALHLSAVRRMFLEADWLVFTLGLTEGWQSIRDKAVFPTAPGVIKATAADPIEFVNFSITEVIDDLTHFLSVVRNVNPKIRFILTVSPVPLIATYEDKHVLTATTYSKSVLRVAAEEAERSIPSVFYFPSYEIITSPAAAGRYYGDDLRQVTEAGVNHVMRVFRRHYMDTLVFKEFYPVNSGYSPVDIVCDEEIIEHSIKVSGF